MSSFSDGFMIGWRQGHAHEQLQRDDRAELSKTFPGNPPALLAPTRCRALKPFYVAGGKVAEVGSVVTLPLDDAKSMAALGKVEIVRA